MVRQRRCRRRRRQKGGKPLLHSTTVINRLGKLGLNKLNPIDVIKADIKNKIKNNLKKAIGIANKVGKKIKRIANTRKKRKSQRGGYGFTNSMVKALLPPGLV